MTDSEDKDDGWEQGSRDEEQSEEGGDDCFEQISLWRPVSYFLTKIGKRYQFFTSVVMMRDRRPGCPRPNNHNHRTT
jgi:hypothetical protein